MKSDCFEIGLVLLAGLYCASGAVPAHAGEAAADAHVAPTISELLVHLGFDPLLEGSVREGLVITMGQPDEESSETELAAAAVMLVVRRPLDEVIGAYMNGDVFRIDKSVLDWREIVVDENSHVELDDQLSGVAYTGDERAEAGKFLSARPGKRFNFSAQEFEWIGSLADQGEPTELASTGYRKILSDRLTSYVESGLSGIPVFDRGKGVVVDPGRDIRIAVESFTFLNEHFPKFRQLVKNHPVVQANDPVAHQFFWLKNLVDKRPQFVLTHHMSKTHESYAVAVDQQFYIGHSLNTLVAVIGCVPYEGGSVVFYTNRVFTDQITGFASDMKRRVGRERLEAAVARFLEELRVELEG